MLLNLRRRIADIADPEWRKSPLIAPVLEHEARLRADPEHQRLRREQDRTFQKQLALITLVVTAVMLAIGLSVIAWLAKSPLATVVMWPKVQEFAGLVTFCNFASFVFIARPLRWRSAGTR